MSYLYVSRMSCTSMYLPIPCIALHYLLAQTDIAEKPGRLNERLATVVDQDHGHLAYAC
jgi:hypothetical protein